MHSGQKHEAEKWAPGHELPQALCATLRNFGKPIRSVPALLLPSQRAPARLLRHSSLPQVLTAEGWVVQAANPFDVDECVGQFTGRHAGFLNAFAATQMFAVYAEQHIPELEPEPQPEPEPA